MATDPCDNFRLCDLTQVSLLDANFANFSGLSAHPGFRLHRNPHRRRLTHDGPGPRRAQRERHDQSAPRPAAMKQPVHGSIDLFGVAIADGQKTTLSQSGIGQSQPAKSFAVEFLVYGYYQKLRPR
jgi:hypothetical protein